MTSTETLRRLPRFPATLHVIESRAKCEICQEYFVVGEDICALPCIHQFHAQCILKWLETSRSCPICRHEVGPPRTARERAQLAERARQEEMDMNLWLGLMMEALEDEETIRAADEAAINRILLEDAATHPIEFTSEPSSVQSIAAGSSQTAAAMIAEREIAAASQQANVVAASIANPGGTHTRLFISSHPPMVGRDDPIIDDGFGHPSMDDPTIIFSDGRPIQIPMPTPVAQPPVQVTQAQVPLVAGPQPVVITNVSTATGPARPVDPPLPPLVNAPTPAVAVPNPSPWYLNELSYGSLPHYPPNHDQSHSFSGPVIGSLSSSPPIQPGGWASSGNPTPLPLPLEISPALPPLVATNINNINFDPRGVVGRDFNQNPQNRVGQIDFSNPSESTYAATMWTQPLFMPPPRPQPTPAAPPPVVNPPVPAPAAAPPAVQPPVITAAPPIVSLSQQPIPPPLPPLPLPPNPVENMPGSSLASQTINSTPPQELRPNSLSPPLHMPEPTLQIPLQVPPTTTTPAAPPQPPFLLSSTTTTPAAPVNPLLPPITAPPGGTVFQQPIPPPVPPSIINGCNPTWSQPPVISFSDQQPHATMPIPPPQPPPPPPPPPPITTPPVTTTTTTTTMTTNNTTPPPPVLLLTNGKELLALFKPAYIPLLGIAVLFIYAFSKMGFVILAGVLVWYAYNNPQGVVKK